MPEPPALPPKEALAEAVKVLGDVMKNEETRFSNLNTRGVAVLSATSLITALAGVFSKDVLGKDFTGWGRQAGGWGLIATVVLLTITAALVVLGVLKPGERLVFGKNDLTDTPSTVADTDAVDRIAFSEYLLVYRRLVDRNTGKARWLNNAYVVFLIAVLAIATTTFLVVVSKI